MMTKNMPVIDRFMEKVRESDDGCWEWTAYSGKRGYGRFYYKGKGALAHRWSYQFHRGEIPAGLVLDHLCRNTVCVNPWHLEPVTPRENALRGIPNPHNSHKTHCPKGHPYSDENTYTGGGGRACLTCKKANARAWYENNRRLTIDRAREWHDNNIERAREVARESQRRHRAKRAGEAA